jgi:PAS domain S-box-containing protein
MIHGEKLKAAGELFYDVCKSSPIGMVVEDLDGRLLFVNPAFSSMLGFSEEEMLSKHCVDFSPAEDAEKDWVLFQQLREGSIDHYHLDKRYFRRDGSLMWGRLSISLLNNQPSPLVVAMVEDITEKMVVQETLELATKEMLGVTRCSRDFRYLWVSEGFARWIQRPLSEIIGHKIIDVIGSDAFEALTPRFERVLSGEKVSYEEQVSFRGIGRRWIAATYTPAVDAGGIVSGWVSVVSDITERKQAEAIVSNFSQKLIQAQEEERASIARELHDDVSQRLVLALLYLDRMTSEEKVPSRLQAEIAGVKTQLRDLAGDIQTLSRRLHSAKVEQLGLRLAAASFCTELSISHNVKIEFRSEAVADNLPGEISLCLFRVMQEALQNSIKHSDSSRFEVLLQGGSNEIQLSVKDSGKGFDPQIALHAEGIGLVSMKERLKLVHGQLSIQAEPGRGTVISASVPLRSTAKTTSAGLV